MPKTMCEIEVRSRIDNGPWTPFKPCKLRAKNEVIIFDAHKADDDNPSAGWERYVMCQHHTETETSNLPDGSFYIFALSYKQPTQDVDRVRNAIKEYYSDVNLPAQRTAPSLDIDGNKRPAKSQRIPSLRKPPFILHRLSGLAPYWTVHYHVGGRCHFMHGVRWFSRSTAYCGGK